MTGVNKNDGISVRQLTNRFITMAVERRYLCVQFLFGCWAIFPSPNLSAQIIYSDSKYLSIPVCL